MKRITTVLLMLLGLCLSASAQYMFVDTGSATPTSGSGNDVIFSVKFDASTINNDWLSLYAGPNNPNNDAFTKACSVGYSSYSGLYGLTSDDGKTQYNADSSGIVSNSNCMLLTGPNGAQGNGSTATNITSQIIQVAYHVKFATQMVGTPIGIWYYGAISGQCPAGCSGWVKVGTWTPTQLSYTPEAFLGMLPQTPPNWNTNYVPITNYQYYNFLPVPPAVKVTIAVCATLVDSHGVSHPDVGAILRPVALDPTPGAYYHWHDTTGLNRPNIIVTTADYTADSNGCILLPIGSTTRDPTLFNSTPEFAGEYWIAVTNKTRGTVILVALGIADWEFVMEPMNLGYGGWAGLNGNWTFSDSTHKNDIGQTSLQFAGKVYGIGNRLVELEPTLSGGFAPAGNKIGIFRLGLGIGGTHDFPGSGSSNFAPFNTDPHGGGIPGRQTSLGGRVADFSNLYITAVAGSRLRLGLRELQAIQAQGCSATPAQYQNGSIIQDNLPAALVWHIAACSGF